MGFYLLDMYFFVELIVNTKSYRNKNQILHFVLNNTCNFYGTDYNESMGGRSIDCLRTVKKEFLFGQKLCLV